MFIIIAIAIWLLIGTFRVWLDFRQPIYNQPNYVRRRSLLIILSLLVLWPILVWSDISWYCRKWKRYNATYLWKIVFQKLNVRKKKISVPIKFEKELKLTAALYASREWIVDHIKETGKLPKEINLPGAFIGMNLLIKERGTNIELTPEEKLVFDAIIAERRLPGGSVILIEDEIQRRKERGATTITQ